MELSPFNKGGGGGGGHKPWEGPPTSRRDLWGVRVGEEIKGDWIRVGGERPSHEDLYSKACKLRTGLLYKQVHPWTHTHHPHVCLPNKE